ncbi:MAG TPA: circadian clock protein KaiC, partial [Acidimicrobiales bacterium]|nr:circadian clock protein KaiC [Acidimicrobiales bacterium]
DRVPKLATGISGFDHIALGGLPAHRPTLVAGTTGSGKTVFAAEFLAQGIRRFGQPGVFVTFEERPDDLRDNLASLGFDIASWEAEGSWAFVDASPELDEEVVSGAYEFNAVVARVRHAVNTVGAGRVALDSLGAVFARFQDPAMVRLELSRVIAALRELGTTAVLTAERRHEYDAITRFGVEEFVADNVVVLRNVMEDEKRRRTVEILKLRGAAHRSGEFSFTVVPGEGISVLPIALITTRHQSSRERVSFGNAELDALFGGGPYRDTVTVVSGPTGIGKSLVASTFVAGGVAAGERCLLQSFEESRDQIMRNAASWGVDLEAMESAGLLRVVSDYPEVASLEDHYVSMRQHIDEFEPQRIAIDNLSGLERVATRRGLRDFIVGLTSFVRQREISTLFTSSTSTLYGVESVTESHASALTDAIVLLRYVEVAGAVRRAICVLKMRGSAHDGRIHEVTIDDSGLHIGEPFTGLAGILAGSIAQWPADAPNPPRAPAGEDAWQ